MDGERKRDWKEEGGRVGGNGRERGREREIVFLKGMRNDIDIEEWEIIILLGTYIISTLQHLVPNCVIISLSLFQSFSSLSLYFFLPSSLSFSLLLLLSACLVFEEKRQSLEREKM
jgi:hypothetical protein